MKFALVLLLLLAGCGRREAEPGRVTLYDVDQAQELCAPDEMSSIIAGRERIGSEAWHETLYLTCKHGRVFMDWGLGRTRDGFGDLLIYAYTEKLCARWGIGADVLGKSRIWPARDETVEGKHRYRCYEEDQTDSNKPVSE